MKSLSQLAITPPDELTIEEIRQDRIARRCAKQMVETKIEPEKEIEPGEKTSLPNLIARSQQGRNRQR